MAKPPKVVIFYASTESGDQYLAVLPQKLSAKEFDKYCRDNYPDEFYDGMTNDESLHGQQIELSIGKAIQL